MDSRESPADHALRGRRYIAYARCAAVEGSERKLREQIRLIRQFADRLGIQCVDEVRLAGVSGWRPVMRADLRKLLARKREKDDYDVLIVTDVARLTRTGLEGLMEIEAEFGGGVRIVYLVEASG